MKFHTNATTCLTFFATLLLLALPAQAQTDAVRVNAGGAEYITTGDGRTFDADDGSLFSEGSSTYEVTEEIQETEADPLYQSERFGEDGFSFDVAVEPGFYNVTLSFAETFMGVSDLGFAECQDDDANETDGPNGCVGERVFDVVIEGETVLEDFDIYAEGGNQTLVPVDMAFADIPVNDDSLNIDFVKLDGQDNPKVSAIEVVYTAEIPVELASFEAVADGQSVLFSWKTLSETNNAGFTVQKRSAHEQAFTDIGSREGAGTTTQVQRYRLTVDGLDPGTHAFRLVQEDFDGTTTPSDPVSVTIRPEAFALSPSAPNPFRHRTRVELTVPAPQEVQVDLFNTLGQKVSSIYEGEVSASRSLTIEAGDLSSGVYLLVAQGEQAQATQELVVMR